MLSIHHERIYFINSTNICIYVRWIDKKKNDNSLKEFSYVWKLKENISLSAWQDFIETRHHFRSNISKILSIFRQREMRVAFFSGFIHRDITILRIKWPCFFSSSTTIKRKFHSNYKFTWTYFMNRDTLISFLSINIQDHFESLDNFAIRCRLIFDNFSLILRSYALFDKRWSIKFKNHLHN